MTHTSATRTATRTTFAVCLLICAGCSSPWSHRGTESLAISHTNSDTLPAPALAAEPQAELPTQVVATAKVTPPPVALTTEQEIALNNLIAEFRTTTVLDSAGEVQLRNELRQALQDEWPLVVKQFRSSRAYREELLARESRQANEFQRASHTPHLPAFPMPSDNANHTTRDLQQLQAAVAQAEGVHLANHLTPVADPAGATPIPRDQPLPVRGTTLANRSTEPQQAAPSQIQQVSHVTSASTDAEWQTQLEATIDAMQADVKTHPGSTDELQEHMRLRMLLLMAGRETDSLAPIPGASPTEQDYWSKQLFALSTYFDTSRQPDTKQRAAGALLHLDEARAKLAELATLQVRNLTFVDKVDGYGLYEPRDSTKFKPGDQVWLYTEVDNFRSESTKEGYRTTFATSYEVVDPQGRRVDGAQFPEVEDLCKNQRHDYHLRYGVALPTRIYPGEYELRLIVSDQLSNKIGQSTVPFEIVE